MGRVEANFSPGGAAADLWAFGENVLPAMWRTAGTFWGSDVPLPVTGRRMTLGHVDAMACIDHFEGRLRPLARQRRAGRQDAGWRRAAGAEAGTAGARGATGAMRS
jgi:hypothetical protein